MTKTLSKLLRKFAVFIAKVSLLTAKSQTGFQSFILIISLKDEPRPKHTSNLDQVECNPHTSTQELALDHNTS